MSRTLRTVATIAGSIALISTGIGAAVGAKGVFLGVSGATFAKVGAIAGVASTAASVGAQMLQPKTLSRAAMAPIVSIEHDTGKRTIERGIGLSLVGHCILGERDDCATQDRAARPEVDGWRGMALRAGQFRHAGLHERAGGGVGQGAPPRLVAVA